MRSVITVDSPCLKDKSSLWWWQCGENPSRRTPNRAWPPAGSKRTLQAQEQGAHDLLPLSLQKMKFWAWEEPHPRSPMLRGSVRGAGAATSTAAGTQGPKTINKRPSLPEPGLGTGLCDFWKPCKKLCVTDGIKNPFTLHGRPGSSC